MLWFRFDAADPGFQFVENVTWLPAFKVAYRMGVDGISVLFVLLSTLLTPICVLASGNRSARVREYMITFLILETMLVGLFCALDFIVFYMFFEGVLIPMYPHHRHLGRPTTGVCRVQVLPLHAAGSVLMLLALLAMWF